MSRIEDKIEEVKEYLGDLESIIPGSFEDYLDSLEKRLACERAFEKIVEGIGDLAILFIKEKRFQLPTEDIKAFDILSENGIISPELAEKMKQAKGMRNLLAHQYGKVDNEIIFEAIQNQVVEDTNKFLSLLK